MSELRTPDRTAAAAMWAAYVAAHPERVGPWEEPTVESFGDHPALADELLGLVLSGRKRATAEVASAFHSAGDPLPAIGGHWIACDSTGAPRVVLRSTELRLGPLESVDDTFAWDEGEGDRSRADWLEGHRRYFTRSCAARGETFCEEQEVVFERFDVVWPEQAVASGAPG